jgi:hypothetical protein
MEPQALSFGEGVEELRRLAAKTARADRPATLALGEMKVVRSALQPRADLQTGEDAAHVEELVRALRAKPSAHQVLDPITVAVFGREFVVIDGHHRLAAYERVGVAAVPVDYFEGSLEDAIREAASRNSRNRLAMNHAEKLESAWRLVLLDKFSRREIAEATGASERTIITMRGARKRLQEQHPGGSLGTWAEAKRTLSGDAIREFSEEMIAAQIREWATRFRKTFGTKATKQPTIFGDALQLYARGLPRALVDHWSDIAREVVEELDDQPF